MRVEAIRFQNFMAFEDTGWIELRPITLLFGKNSSGKSVIGRALRFLKQSLDLPPNAGPFVYSARHGVDVGDFGNMIHTSPTSPQWPRPVIFGFRCRVTRTADALARVLNSHLRREGEQPLPRGQPMDQVEVSYRYEWNDEIEQAQLTELNIRLAGPPSTFRPSQLVFSASRLDYRAATGGEDEWWYWSDILHGHESDEDSAWSGSGLVCRSGFLPVLVEARSRRRNPLSSDADFEFVAELVEEVGETISRFLRQLDHLGPLRPLPERAYVFGAEEIAEWENCGLRGYLRYLRDDIGDQALHDVDRLLKAVGLCHRAQVFKHADFGSRGLFSEVHIYESADERYPRNLVDVGFGLSQVLPIIVQSIVAEDNSMMLIEQPELHLHPGAQALLTDMLIEQLGRGRRLVQEREDLGVSLPSIGRLAALEVRYLLETHSEHILLRLRRRVAETTAGIETPLVDAQLSDRDLNIYFVDREGGRSTIQLVSIDQSGNMGKLPKRLKGFFTDDTRDVLKLTEAALHIDGV